MSDKRYTKDGEYLSKAATLELNERHGWMQYGDAQSDASNAFANNAVHAFLESAKQAQEVMAETGLTPRQLVEQRDALTEALDWLMASRNVPGTEARIEAEKKAHAALALVKGATP